MWSLIDWLVRQFIFLIRLAARATLKHPIGAYYFLGAYRSNDARKGVNRTNALLKILATLRSSLNKVLIRD
jgi:hypothetical protein